MLNYVDLNVCSHFVTGNVNARYAIKASQPFFFFSTQIWLSIRGQKTQQNDGWRRVNFLVYALRVANYLDIPKLYRMYSSSVIVECRYI